MNREQIERLLDHLELEVVNGSKTEEGYRRREALMSALEGLASDAARVLVTQEMVNNARQDWHSNKSWEQILQRAIDAARGTP